MFQSFVEKDYLLSRLYCLTLSLKIGHNKPQMSVGLFLVPLFLLSQGT